MKRGADEEWSTGSDAFGSATNSDSDEFETMETEGMKVESGTTSNADGTSSTRSGVVATSSNIERQTLKGQWLEMVLADRRAGRGFVTTAENLELEQLKDLASDSDADFYESETEIAVVRAWAEQGSLPDHASLEVTQISGDEGQDGEEYQEYQRAKEALDQQEIAYDGMMAFDIGFLDEQGEEIEPDGVVEVHIELKDGALPEDADPESLAVQHLLENGEEMEEFVPPEEALMEKLIQIVRTRFTDEEDGDDEE